MTKNHPLEQIIGSRNKCVMIRSRINEELCCISLFAYHSILLLVTHTYSDCIWLPSSLYNLQCLPCNLVVTKFYSCQQVLWTHPNDYRADSVDAKIRSVNCAFQLRLSLSVVTKQYSIHQVCSVCDASPVLTEPYNVNQVTQFILSLR